jgi:hypothetical protein
MIGPRSTELVAEATLALRRVHRRGADSHDPRAPDDVGSRGRGRARRARRGDTYLGLRYQGSGIRGESEFGNQGVQGYRATG